MSSMKLEIGAELPEFIRETGLENWNRYAAVNEEFVDHHMDDDAGKRSGMPGAFGMGNLQWSYFHNVVRGWMGESGSIRQMTIQFQQPNFKDTTVTARAKITDIEDSDAGQLVSLDLWTEDNNDRRLASGQAIILISN